VSGPLHDPRANPLARNPLADRGDLQRAVCDLVDPLIPHMSPGGARVRLGSGAAVFPQRVAELEGYARPLYGIVPHAVGGGEFAHWDRWRDGLAAGTDPAHPEYWGAVESSPDQRMVEMAAIGWAMAMVPDHFWDPLDAAVQERTLAWLDGIDRYDPVPNNWQFFRLLVHAGRERVGAPGDADAARRSVELIDDYHLGDGWYRDGALGNVDWYVPFAFHTYGLMLHATGLGDREAAGRWVDRARAFAPDFGHWFGPDGAGVAFGRSQTYRFAQCSLWGALALADVDAVPWGEAKGHNLRHLRWWSRLPVSDRDGVLSLGYTYDNRRLLEGYNSAQSPYWAMKAFGALAAPADHPFWTTAETPQAPLDAPVALPHAGWVSDRDAHHTVLLSGKRTPAFAFLEQTRAKYGKLAYSSRFGFAGDVEFGYGDPGTDSALLVDDGTGRRTRWDVEDAFVEDAPDGAMSWSRWRPYDDVVIETVLVGGSPWHHRLHLVRTDRALTVTDTGFSVATEALTLGAGTAVDHGDGAGTIRTDDAVSAIVGSGDGSVRPLPPNASIVHPHAAFPALTRPVDPGEQVLVCSVLGSADPTAGIEPPPVPETARALLERERDRVADAPAVDPAVEALARRRRNRR